MKDIWNFDLKNVFQQEEEGFITGPPPAKKANHGLAHGRFNAWLFWAYGKKEQIRKLLQIGIPDKHMLRVMQTTQWHV